MRTLLLFFALLISQISFAKDYTIPAPLEQWEQWVIEKHDEIKCPIGKIDYQCTWPGLLRIDVQDDFIGVSQSWDVSKKNVWVPLLGNNDQWPVRVLLNGDDAPITENNKMPGVFIKNTGKHHIITTYLNNSEIDSINIPKITPMVELLVNDNKVNQPQIDSNGTLYFNSIKSNQNKNKLVENKLSIDIFRLLTDNIPFELTSRFEFRISGTSREISLAGVLPEDYTPLSITSKLPVRIDNNELRVQVKPGKWIIELRARANKKVNTFTYFTSGDKWPANEIWAFRDMSEFRQIEINGINSIDPYQTRLPNKWKKFPTFLAQPNTAINIKEIKRGNPTPAANELKLSRHLWLNFDGNGYSVRDQIKGTMNRDWRINAQDDLNIGRVTSSNKGQFITQSIDGKQGVELRNQKVSIVAESQIPGNINELSATGWDTNFSQVSASLHIPPGWSVLSISGAEQTSGTWIEKWTLLDLFFLLIVSASVTKLWNWRWGLVAAATLTLTTHDWMAPYWIWMNLIAASALLRVVKHEKISKWLNRYRIMTVAVLVMIALPYFINEIRMGIYPQLERGLSYNANSISQINSFTPAKQIQKRRVASSTDRMKENKMGSYLAGMSESDASYGRGALAPKRKFIPQFDPNAKIQTGPGMPEWSGKTFPLVWSGPVNSEQKLKIIYITPGEKLFIAIIKVLLITALAFCLVELNYILPQRIKDKIPQKFLSATLALFIGITSFIQPAGDAMANTMPSPELLKQLEQRLTEKPECLPNCVNIQRTRILILGNELAFAFKVNSAVNSYITLPIQMDSWQPAKVIMDGDKETGMQRNSSGYLRVQVPEGDHDVIIQGSIEGLNSLSLPSPYTLHNVTSDVSGWEIAGIDKMGNINGQLKLTRIKEKTEAEKKVLRPSSMPNFLRITRSITIGLEWEVHTRVERISGGSDPILVSIPLLSGESVNSAGYEVINNEIKIKLPSGQNQTAWNSTLKRVDSLVITTRDSFQWSEVWELNVSPIWQVKAAGIPETNHKRNGRLGPSWHPWPGEKLTLNISRPKGIDGATMTVNRVTLDVKPGERMTDNELTLKVLASQGGQHKISLPEGVQVKSVTTGGRSLVIEDSVTDIGIPIRPGEQDIKIKWSNNNGISNTFSTPKVNIGLPTVNTHITLNPGDDRWVLLVGGPNQGPAILFWGVFCIVVFIALILGQVKGLPIKTSGWILLGIGLLPVSIETVFVIVAWLFLLKFRSDKSETLHALSPVKFNFIQVAIVLLTLFVIVGLISAIEQGLLGSPDMQIKGNNSWTGNLKWYEDRGDNYLASAWAFSVPMYFYRISMLLWALWLAFSCLKWISWGWESFSNNGSWKTVKFNITNRKSKKQSKKNTLIDAVDDLDINIKLKDEDDSKKK